MKNENQKHYVILADATYGRLGDTSRGWDFVESFQNIEDAEKFFNQNKYQINDVFEEFSTFSDAKEFLENCEKDTRRYVYDILQYSIWEQDAEGGKIVKSIETYFVVETLK